MKIISRVLCFFIFILMPETGVAAYPDNNDTPNSNQETRLEKLCDEVRQLHNKNPQKALETGEEALELFKTHPDDKKEMKLLSHLSFACTQLGYPPRARELAKQSLAIAEKIGSEPGKAGAYFNIGISYHDEGNFSKAWQYFTDARQIYESCGHQTGLADSIYHLSQTYWRVGDFAKALDLVLDAREIYKKNGNIRGLADLDNMSAHIYHVLGEEKKAFRYYLQANKRYTELKDKFGIAKTYNNMGTSHTLLGEYSQALAAFEKTLTISREMGYRQLLSYALNNIGDVYTEQNKFDVAMEYYDKSLEIKRKLGDQLGIAYTLIRRGVALRKQKRYPEAEKSLCRGFEIAVEISLRAEINKACLELSLTHEAMGNYSRALHFYKQFKEFSDVLFTEKTRNRIAEMQTTYELGKKEKEIQLLKRNRKLRQMELEHQGNLTRYYFAVLFLVLVAIFVIYARIRIKNKLSRALKAEVENHKQTGRELAESEKTFKTLVEKSTLGVYILQDNRLKYVNPMLLSIFGYTFEEARRKSPMRMIYHEDRLLAKKHFQSRLSDSMAAQGYNFRGITHDGRIIYLENYGGRIDYRGRPAVLGTLIDVTRRKQTEEELLESRKLEAVGILAGGIAHDFNNLLSVIMGSVNMAKSFCETDRSVLTLLTEAERASYRASDLAQKFITFSKGGWLLLQKVGIAQIFKTVADEKPELADLIRPINIHPRTESINGDERQLAQALAELLENATDTGTDPEDVHIEVQNVTLDKKNPFSLKEGKYVEISICNKEKNISAEQLDKVFKPYFSSKKDITKNGKGLGLTICHSIIKKHEGHITVTSEVGKGTIFNIYLPAYQIPERVDI